MKTIIITAISLMLISNAYADEYPTAHLQMKVTGNKDNAYFLCISNAGGCSRISPTTSVVVDTGKVSYIYTMNVTNGVLYTQPLPASCQISLAENQTLIVRGKLVINEKNATIQNLSCQVKA